MSSETGAQALKGVPEYINIKLFEAVEYDRKITGRGKLIQVYDPKADLSSPPHWVHENPTEDATGDVPRGYKVEVAGATVKFI